MIDIIIEVWSNPSFWLAVLGGMFLRWAWETTRKKRKK